MHSEPVSGWVMSLAELLTCPIPVRKTKGAFPNENSLLKRLYMGFKKVDHTAAKLKFDTIPAFDLF